MTCPLVDGGLVCWEGNSCCCTCAGIARFFERSLKAIIWFLRVFICSGVKVPAPCGCCLDGSCPAWLVAGGISDDVADGTVAALPDAASDVVWPRVRLFSTVHSYHVPTLTVDAICTVRAIGNILGDGRVLLLLYLTLLSSNSFLLLGLPFPKLLLLANRGKEVMGLEIFRVILANSIFLHLHVFLR